MTQTQDRITQETLRTLIGAQESDDDNTLVGRKTFEELRRAMESSPVRQALALTQTPFTVVYPSRCAPPDFGVLLVSCSDGLWIIPYDPGGGGPEDFFVEGAERVGPETSVVLLVEILAGVVMGYGLANSLARELDRGQGSPEDAAAGGGTSPAEG